MRILFITEKFPYPLDTGGNVRTFHMLKSLSTEHDVTLLANGQPDLGEESVDRVRNICADIELISDASTSKLKTIGQVASCLAGRNSLVLQRHATRSVALAIRRLLSDEPRNRSSGHTADHKGAYDAVHFNHLDAAQYEAFVPHGMLRVLDEHNVVTNQVRTTLNIETRAIRRWALRRESRVLPTVERMLCNKMDLCITCSDVDRASLRSLGVTAKIGTVANGVDLEYFKPTIGSSRVLEAVFVGTLDYDPCDKAVRYFCQNILPKLHQRHPNLRFVVVGRNPSEDLRQLAEHDQRIVLTGRVDDVRRYLCAAAVFVVPLLSGSGTRLKILEALAAGTPVVTTRIGVEGIDAISEEHLIVADDPEEFATAVSGILESTTLADRLKKAGRLLVEQRYGWNSCCKKLLQEYRSIEFKR